MAYNTVLMRIFLLRLFVGWWMIILLTVVALPLWCLIGGKEGGFDCYKSFIDMVWNGDGD